MCLCFFPSKNEMSRTRRQLALRIPTRLLRAQHKRHGPTGRQILVADPVLCPILSVHRQTLHVVSRRGVSTLLRGSDVHKIPIPDTQIEIAESRTQDQIHGLRDDGIQADEVPDQPAVDGAAVAVPRQPLRGGEVVVVDGLAAAQHALELAAAGKVVVEEGGGEAGLVARVEERAAHAVGAAGADARGFQPRREHGVEARFGRLGAAHEADQRRHVEGHGPGVLPR